MLVPPDISPPVLDLRVTLSNIEPEIWRIVRVPGHLSLLGLHHVIQEAMGWDSYHLFQFLHEDHQGAGIYQDFALMDPVLIDPGLSDAGTTALSSVLAGEGEEILYEYDLATSWEHRVVVDRIVGPEDPDGGGEGGDFPARCLAGAGRCPPEDCGGIPGYLKMLRCLSDPDDELHEDWLHWMPDGFDPLEFDPEEANLRLRTLAEAGWKPDEARRLRTESERVDPERVLAVRAAALTALDEAARKWEEGNPHIVDLATDLIHESARLLPEATARARKPAALAAGTLYKATDILRRMTFQEPGRDASPRLTAEQTASLFGVSVASVRHWGEEVLYAMIESAEEEVVAARMFARLGIGRGEDPTPSADRWPAWEEGKGLSPEQGMGRDAFRIGDIEIIIEDGDEGMDGILGSELPHSAGHLLQELGLAREEMHALDAPEEAIDLCAPGSKVRISLHRLLARGREVVSETRRHGDPSFGEIAGWAHGLGRIPPEHLDLLARAHLGLLATADELWFGEGVYHFALLSAAHLGARGQLSSCGILATIRLALRYGGEVIQGIKPAQIAPLWRVVAADTSVPWETNLALLAGLVEDAGRSRTPRAGIELVQALGADEGVPIGLRRAFLEKIAEGPYFGTFGKINAGAARKAMEFLIRTDENPERAVEEGLTRSEETGRDDPGVAAGAALQALGEDLSPETILSLVKRGLASSRPRVRDAFFRVGLRHLGGDVRQWAPEDVLLREKKKGKKSGADSPGGPPGGGQTSLFD